MSDEGTSEGTPKYRDFRKKVERQLEQVANFGKGVRERANSPIDDRKECPDGA